MLRKVNFVIYTISALPSRSPPGRCPVTKHHYIIRDPRHYFHSRKELRTNTHTQHPSDATISLLLKTLLSIHAYNIYTL